MGLPERSTRDTVAGDSVSSVAVITTGATGTAGSTLAGSTPVVIALPYGNYERYLGVRCITATTTTTAGKINAFLTLDASAWRPYADNVA